MIPYELLQDLNRLACVSKNKKVEDLFLKLAEENQKGFFEWLKQNKNNKFIVPYMSNNSTIDALIYLFNNEQGLRQNWLSILNSEKTKPYVFTYHMLSKILDQPRFSTILSPYQTVLSRFANMKPRDSSKEDEVNLINDLIFLQRRYDQAINESRVENNESRVEHIDRKKIKKQRKKQRKERNDQSTAQRALKEKGRLVQAFSFFFYNFSQEIANAMSKEQDPLYQKTYQLVMSKKLDEPNEIDDALPYSPQIKNAVNSINSIYRKIINGEWVKRGGLVGAYNLARIELFNGIGLSAGYQSGTNEVQEQQPSEGIDSSKLYDMKGKVNQEYIDNIQISKQRREESIANFNWKSVRQASYIKAVSMLLGKMKTSIEQYEQLED